MKSAFASRVSRSAFSTPISMARSGVRKGSNATTFILRPSARLATMDFTVANQSIETKNLEIQGAGFELFGDGGVGFPSGRLALTVRINAKGIPGLVLFPVSKLLEYVSNGTMSEPLWRPKIIPKELFEVLGMGGDAAPKEKPPARRP